MSWLFARSEGMDWFVNVRPTMLDDTSWFKPFVETCTSEMLTWATTGAAHSLVQFPPFEAYESLTRAYMANHPFLGLPVVDTIVAGRPVSG